MTPRRKEPMTYPADPGGVFASDSHRRLLGHLPPPDDEPTSDVEARLSQDIHGNYGDSEGVLKDLEADGLATHDDAGWKQTAAGLDQLNAPVPGEEDGN